MCGFYRLAMSLKSGFVLSVMMSGGNGACEKSKHSNIVLEALSLPVKAES
jgi:hypothetical protein